MVIESNTEKRSNHLGRATVLKALADEARIKVVNALIEKPHCAEELSLRLKRAPSTISFHLRKLEEAGIVTKAKTQYYVVYSLKLDLLQMRLIDFLNPSSAQGNTEKRRLDQYRAKVVRTFFKNGRLLQIPKQWRKRLIVIEEILSVFDNDRDYTEREVNDQISLYYDDYCTIRRMLIDEKLMSRQGGIYRRLPLEKSPVKTNDNEKTLKRQYKETPREAGIFRITNNANGKIYLGSSLNLHGPLNKHRFVLSIGSHINKELQADWKRFGQDAFVFEIVDIVQRKDSPDFKVEDELEILEEMWIEKEKPFSERGYNNRRSIRE